MSYQLYHQRYGEWAEFDRSHASTPTVTPAQQIAIYTVAAVILGYALLQRLDYFPLLPIQELMWNGIVYVTPPSLVMVLDKGEGKDSSGYSELEKYADSRTFAAKSAAMRRILGIQGSSILTAIPRPRAFSGVGSLLKGSRPSSLAGLGNWDNSCYQNCIIQGLASLPSVTQFLDRVGDDAADGDEPSTRTALSDIIAQLNDPENGGRRLWTPAALKSMSSWQQQDAQEYYSKVLDDVEKEAKRTMGRSLKHEGLRMVKNLERGGSQRTDPGLSGEQAEGGAEEEEGPTDDKGKEIVSNPLEGLLAQRVGCLRCGYVEGLSLVPFNCMTLPLSRSFSNRVEDCIDDFTQLESIEGVECGQCTLLRSEGSLKELLARDQAPGMEDLFAQARLRLAAVQQALADGDFSESTIAKKCQISGKQRVTSTKTKQTVVARGPESLVLHFNRSVFDEMTGMLSKNTSRVGFPEMLDLGCWTIGNNTGELEQWSIDPNTSLLAGSATTDTTTMSATHPSPPAQDYVLRAVITHYGRHENGHYICYRRDPNDAEQWWRLSDDDVSPANEDEVLGQGNVFMLFYTRSSDGDELVQTEQLPSSSQAPSLTMQEELQDAREEPVTAQQKPKGGVEVEPDQANRSTAEHPRRISSAGENKGSPPVEVHGKEDVPLPTGAGQNENQDAALKNRIVPSVSQSGTDQDKDGESSDFRSVIANMRTASSKKPRSRRGSRPGMQGMSNMVVAN